MNVRTEGNARMRQGLKAPSGRHIWKGVRDELMLNLYPLPFSTLAPTVYHVYLHPDEFAAIAPIAPRIVDEVQRALTAEVEKVNASLERSGRRVIARLLRREDLPPIQIPAAGWEIHLRADHNGEIACGQLGIVSTLAMPAPVEYAGTPTTRIVKSVVGGGKRSASVEDVPQPRPTGDASAPPQGNPPSATGRTTPPRQDVTAASPNNGSQASEGRGEGNVQATSVPVDRTGDAAARARLTYADDQGPHVFIMRKDAVAIGRGGSAAWVDVQVVSGSKVSREHCRIRREGDGRFFVRDVSLWGTSVDGVQIPPAVKGAEGVSQPGPEHPLPSRARIGLADTVFLDFDGTAG